MTSDAQVEANRRNALKSTGPNDTLLTRGNALKHGLTAEKLVVLPYENALEYEELIERFRVEFQPDTAVEEILVEQMATSIWRLRRIRKAERAEIQKRLAYALLKFATHLDEFGGPTSYNHYAVGWAHAMDTPYQWTKQVASTLNSSSLCLHARSIPLKYDSAK